MNQIRIIRKEENDDASQELFSGKKKNETSQQTVSSQLPQSTEQTMSGNVSIPNTNQ